jgi:hypothetical protein
MLLVMLSADLSKISKFIVIARKETDSTEAKVAFLQGWAHYWQDTRDDLIQVITYFELAVKLDPNSRLCSACGELLEMLVIGLELKPGACILGG